MHKTHSAKAILSDVMILTSSYLIIIETMEFIMVNSYENIDLFKVREEASQMRSEFISKLFVKMLTWLKASLSLSNFKHA